jgi:hypothetical protein
LFWNWLISTVVFSVLVVGVLFLYAAPGLRLEPGRKSKLWASIRRIAGITVIAGSLLVLSGSPAWARHASQTQAEDLQIAIDLASSVVKTGDKVEYNTVITNNGTEASPPLIVAMNVINLDAKGEVVDPEDWSPQRTQYLETLAGGQSTSQHWIINTILDGNYMVYMVLIPAPGAQEATSQPLASSGIHLTVTPFTRLNPGGVLLMPLAGHVVLLGIIVLYRMRRKQIDAGGSK